MSYFLLRSLFECTLQVWTNGGLVSWPSLAKHRLPEDPGCEQSIKSILASRCHQRSAAGTLHVIDFCHSTSFDYSNYVGTCSLIAPNLIARHEWQICWRLHCLRIDMQLQCWPHHLHTFEWENQACCMTYTIRVRQTCYLPHVCVGTGVHHQSMQCPRSRPDCLTEANGIT